MKRRSLLQFSLIIILCILLNYFGALLALALHLPMWLDSFGTLLSAYVGGPIVGSMVGLTGNLIKSMATGISPVYALVSIALAVIFGAAARKKMLESWLGIISVEVVITIVTMAITIPLNWILRDGRTGNLWGDGVIDRLQNIGTPKILASIAGQFYLEFVDKLLTITLLFLVIQLIRKFSGQTNKPSEKNEHENLKMLLIPAFLLTVSWSLPQDVSAQIPVSQADAVYNNYVQTVYSSENGLPCGEANDIVQTNDGVLWIGTYAGLYRYNGREFRRMDEFETVRNVNSLFVDQEGRLWIGTNDNGLAIAINETITNVVDQSNGLPSNSVRSIIQCADGYYYVGTTDSMQVFSLNNGLKVVNTLREINYADGIAADNSGHVAAVTQNGCLFLMTKGHILSSRQLPGQNEFFRSCTFSPTGELLAGTSQGRIYIFDISNDRFNELTVLEAGKLSSIKALNFLENGDLFAAADNGIGYFDNQRAFHFINTNEFNSSIDNTLVDYQGNLWFTSSRLGLLRLAPSAFLDIYSTIGMEHNVTNAAVFWNGAYYFGTDKGLDIVNAEMTEQIHDELSEKLQGVRIRCMLVDSKGSLWICTYGRGLFEIEADGTEHVYTSNMGIFGNRVRIVKELSDGTILAGTDVGISYIRDHEIDETLTNSTETIDSMILTITELPDHRILVGTDGDGIAIIENEKVTDVLTRENGLSSEVILRTIYDSKGEGVFIITSNGLCYMNRDGSVRFLSKFPYFNNYDAYIDEDEDRLFVLSSAGIYIADREEVLADQPDTQYELLNAQLGLNSSLTANSWYYADETGRLFLPCDSGIYSINTKDYRGAGLSYRMSVTSVKLDGEESNIERNKTITVPRNTSRIEITPEIINYSVHTPTVGYYLEGFDKDWIIMPLDMMQIITYTNLPVGDYVFHLGVFDSNQQTLISQRSYDVIKPKEIYDNNWFMIYIAAVPISAAIWFTSFIVFRRNKRQMELQRKELELSQQQVKMSNDTIIAIARAVDAKDERTSQHSWRVSEYSVLIGKQMGLSEEDVENLRRAALVHDIGKIGIADAILNKDSKLTDEEYAIMKSHTSRGAEILKDLTYIPHVLDGALYHHERIDGRGYPQGLKGDDIPLYSRIIGVADAFDAMTANRVYRKQMDLNYVIGEMERGRGTQFDPEIDDILLRMLRDGTIDLKKLYPGMNDQPDSTDQGGAA